MLNTTSFPTMRSMKTSRIIQLSGMYGFALSALLMLCGQAAAQSLNQFDNMAVQAMRQRQRSSVSVRYRAADMGNLRLPDSNRQKQNGGQTTGGQDRVIDRQTYRLAPGDGLLFSIWGEIDDSYELSVTPEGDLLIPSEGPIHVAGRTIADAQSAVEEAARESYRNSRITLSLMTPRTFRVHLTGRVKKPGTYEATPFDRVSDIISQAEGFATGASYRRIAVRREGADDIGADLVRYFLAGDLTADPYVDMGDLIHVPARGDSVLILGAVNEPGSVEFRPGDTVGDLVELAGGVSAQAVAERMEWTSFPADTGASQTRIVNLVSVTGRPVRAGDILTIPGRGGWHHQAAVIVRGEVHSPGGYSIVEGRTRVSDVLRRAGGLTRNASQNASRLIRPGSDVNDDPEYLRLHEGRTLSTDDPVESAYYRLRSRQSAPGVALNLAAALERPGSVDDALLAAGDTLLIERVRSTVELLGQVRRPGLISYVEGGTVGFYLEQAGGFSWRAAKGQVRLIRAGTEVWIEPDNDTVVYRGDTIFVPDREHTNWWQVSKDLVLLISQITGTIATIVILSR